MKRWIRLSILPALLLFCSLLLLPEAQAATEGYYTYSVSNGKATITDCSTAISGDITIPSTLGGYPVTAIGYQAFEDCTALTGVIIPEGVTSIGGRAFYQCTGLTDIALPDSVAGIGSYAFAWCESLTGIEIPDGITGISDDMFFHCTALTGVEIPDSVKTIGGSAFSYCWSLTAIDIPESVTEIGGSAFFHCKALTDITVPEGVTTLESYVFAYCQSLTHLEIPGSVTAISSHAFYNCTSLERIAIPGGVTTIEESAFRDCSSLTEIVIPNSVTVIGENAFRGCDGLTELTIPGGVTTIKKYAFGECTGLLRVTVPDNVTTMGNDVFRECTALTEVTLGKGITSISGYAFWGCTALKEITIPAGVTAIGNYAFTSCTSMTRVTVPASVTTVGNGAFRSCTALTEINVADLAAWLNIAFGTADSNPMRANIDKKLLINGQVVSELELPASITELPEYAFYRCASLNSVVIPGNVATIGGNAFYNCSGLTKLTVLDGVTGIGTQAFYNCTALTDISLAGSVAAIGTRGFYGCKALTEMILPEGVTQIGTAAFCDCTALTDITIPGSVTTIGSSAFSRCSSLRYVNYEGTMAQWAEISIGDTNEPLLAATLHTREETVAAAIVGQPADVLVQAGDTANFTVIAEGDGLSYRWQYSNDSEKWNNTSLPGYNTNTLTIYNVQGAGYHGRQFRCVVTDANGNTVTSEPAALSVPYIVKQPATAFGTAVNSDHKFTVEYSISEGVTYQWQYKGNTASSTTWNNTTMAGNKTNTLTVPAIATRNGYRYRCIINDNGTEIVTKEVILYVTAAEAVITKQPAAASAVCGDYATFTVEATGDGLSYQWQWSDDGESWSDTRGTGYATSTLTVKTNNFNGGRLYRCVVKTVNGSAYNKVYSEPALMTVLPAAEITQQPQSVTVWAGETALFHVEAEGEDLSYQWQWAKYLGNWMNTTAAGNTTDTLTVSGARKDMNGRYYRVIITNQYTGTVTTQYCQLFVE